MQRFLLLMILLFSSSGCAFIGGGEIGEAVYKSSVNGWHSWIDNTLASSFNKASYDSSTKKFISPANIEAVWGKPERIIIKNNKKHITYNKGLRWKGMIAIVIIPIPIAVPVGHKTVTFNFENDQLQNWEIHDSHYCVSYTGFNLIPLDPEGKSLGFFAERDCEWHKDMDPRDDMACGSIFYDKCFSLQTGMTGKNLN